jgi:hypothetical protein
MRPTTTIGTTLIAFSAALAIGLGTAIAAPSPEAARSPVPIPSRSDGVDLGTKTSGVGTTDPVAQPSAGRQIDPLSPDHQTRPEADTPGKTGLGVTDHVPLGHPGTGPGSKTDGIGSPPAAGAGAE